MNSICGEVGTAYDLRNKLQRILNLKKKNEINHINLLKNHSNSNLNCTELKFFQNPINFDDLNKSYSELQWNVPKCVIEVEI